MNRLITLVFLLLLSLSNAIGQPLNIGRETTFTKYLKTLSDANQWQAALGLGGASITASNVTVIGTGAGALKLLDSTANASYFANITAPSTIVTNYNLILPDRPANGSLSGTYDGANTVTLAWGSSSSYLGISTVPYAWYDARTNVYNTGTTPATDNQTVSQWSDLSGNGRHLTNTFTGNQWVYKLNQQNGLPGLTGTSVQMQTSQSFGGLTSMTVFAVLQPVSWTGYAMYVGGTTQSSGTDWVYLQGSASGDVYFGWGAGTDRATSPTFVAASTTYTLQGRVTSLLAGLRKNTGNWIDAVASSTGSSPATALRVGRADQATSFKMFALVIYSPALSASDSTIVEQNLNTSWGVH